MNRKPYDAEKESKITGTMICLPNPNAKDGKMPKPATPISYRDNILSMLKGEPPQWLAYYASEVQMFNPRFIPDNIARAMVSDAEPMEGIQKGGKDLFGVDWEYEALVNGSMVKPGNPKCPDINQWEKYITFPDLEKLDWKRSSEINSPYLSDDRMNEWTVFSGLFERLISFCDFEGAAMALMDEDQQDAVHRLFDKLADFYDDYFGLIKKHFKVDIIQFHDDWGSQRAPFFSIATCREMLVPYLKRIAESAHKRGMYFHLHCCGKNEMLVPAMIEAGVDIWIPQPMNDSQYLIKNFNDKIVLGVNPPKIEEDIDDARARELCEEFVKSTFAVPYPRVFCFASSVTRTPSTMKLLKHLYPVSREYYSKL